MYKEVSLNLNLMYAKKHWHFTNFWINLSHPISLVNRKNLIGIHRSVVILYAPHLKRGAVLYLLKFRVWSWLSIKNSYTLLLSISFHSQNGDHWQSVYSYKSLQSYCEPCHGSVELTSMCGFVIFYFIFLACSERACVTHVYTALYRFRIVLSKLREINTNNIFICYACALQSQG